VSKMEVVNEKKVKKNTKSILRFFGPKFEKWPKKPQDGLGIFFHEIFWV